MPDPKLEQAKERLDLQASEANLRKVLTCILEFQPIEVCKDAFAYDRMVESYREAARVALTTSPEPKDKRTGWLIVSGNEAKLRFLLWAMHPCLGKYGDDGELQCSCGSDFRRDSVDEIERKTWEMNMRKLARAPE